MRQATDETDGTVNEGDGTDRSRSVNHTGGTVIRAANNGDGTDTVRSTKHADGTVDLKIMWVLL